MDDIIVSVSSVIGIEEVKDYLIYCVTPWALKLHVIEVRLFCPNKSMD